MNFILSELRSQLNDREQKTVGPVFDLDPADIDQHSELKIRSDFLIASFVSWNDLHCPFEIGVGRGHHARRLNIFVGLGADFYNYEDIDTEEDVMSASEDIGRFLRSTVECEQFMVGDEVRRAIYRPSLIEVGGRPIVLCFRGRQAVFPRPKKRLVKYVPWMQGPSTPSRYANSGW